MAGVDFMSRMRSVLRRERSDRDWSSTAPLDEELVEEDSPRFSRLKVVVSGEMDNYTTTSSNGTPVNTFVTNADDDDESMLGLSSGSGSPGVAAEPCESCTKKKEQLKRSRVMRKLALAAMLYFLFMIGELIGKREEPSLKICVFPRSKGNSFEDSP
ncbi:hypothetical protein NFI96_001555 [Prochilodus magdalenae]|nr:hypothetical protein NFI96_001555 [Prochilodus magdalenae]